MLPLELFVPGALRNPLNGSFSRAHWHHKSQWATDWKTRTWAALLATPDWRERVVDLQLPKHIHFLAQTGAVWDDDSIPAAIKPCRDALIGYVIHSDAPTSGHRFTYDQVICRQERGVHITIRAG